MEEQQARPLTETQIREIVRQEVKRVLHAIYTVDQVDPELRQLVISVLDEVRREQI